VALLSYALVTGGTVAVRHRNWYCIGGLCDIKARYKDELKPWQPDQAIPRHKRGAGGYWRMVVQFDQITAGRLRRHGVPVSVDEKRDRRLHALSQRLLGDHHHGHQRHHRPADRRA
jgi:hypothetical protein